MNDWVVETPSFEEYLMNNRVVMLNQNGVNRVVEIIKEKDKEIERLNNIINEIEKYAGLGELNWEDKYQDIMLSSKGLLKRIKELNKHIKEGIEKDIIIDKAKAKLRSMFDNGNEETILDDLLELDKVLGSDNE